MNGAPRVLRALPIGAIVVGILAGALHLAPYLYARAAAPPGRQFTGNLKVANPDYMQYRVWFRQTQREGPIVRDSFTTEPNRPHVVVIVPYLIGRVAQALSLEPEWVSTWAGSGLAVVFSALLFVLVRSYFPSRHQQWWVFLAAMIGGGLGGHLKLILRFEAINSIPIVRLLLWDPLDRFPIFEDLRGHFIFNALFDTHFLLHWTLCAACVMAFHGYLKRPQGWRLAMTAALFGLMTIVHLYEGITLLMIVSAIALLCWIRRAAVRPALIGLAVTSAAIIVCLAWQASLRDPNVPIPSWRGPVIPVAVLFIAYPLAWVLTIVGLPRLWRDADLDTLVLLGWLLGCTALTLSGPFYPYPARGTLTLQIPLTILAGLAYFRVRPRVTRKAALAAVLIMGATPFWFLGRQFVQAQDANRSPAVFQNASHRTIIDTLVGIAGPNDVLLARQQDLIWLAPEYPGRHYCGHFFLTVDYDRKAREVDRFFAGNDATRSQFMRAQGIRFVFVAPAQKPATFSGIPGLRQLVETPEGSLFEYGAEL
jgi:hypothetical protein